MAVIGIDLGGTKLAAAVFLEDGVMEHREVIKLEGRGGNAVCRLITDQINRLLSIHGDITSIGVSVPGISYVDRGTVWAPNIPGWEDYPLLDDIHSCLDSSAITVAIDSDRACYILGETWRGIARGSKDAVFIAVGTGIGAGIMIDGAVLRGHSDIAGAIGWMALDRPYTDEYDRCGCFEYYASGDGLARTAARFLAEDDGYTGVLRNIPPDELTSRDIFTAYYESNDPVAARVIDLGVEFWGMAVANVVSIFNPEIIVFGGGVFGPAGRLLDRIKEEAVKWAQPIAVRQVTLEVSSLGDDAGLIGAGRLALMHNNTHSGQ